MENLKLYTMSQIPFTHINWTAIEKVEYKGDTGIAFWQTIQYPGLRIRLVEYSSDYLADHWCQKGHIVHCLSGEFISELSTGEKIKLEVGSTEVRKEFNFAGDIVEAIWALVNQDEITECVIGSGVSYSIKE